MQMVIWIYLMYLATNCTLTKLIQYLVIPGSVWFDYVDLNREVISICASCDVRCLNSLSCCVKGESREKAKGFVEKVKEVMSDSCYFQSWYECSQESFMTLNRLGRDYSSRKLESSQSFYQVAIQWCDKMNSLREKITLSNFWI